MQAPDKLVSVHFNMPGHTFDDMTIMVVEQMRVPNSSRKKCQESFWTHTLQSLNLHSPNLESQGLMTAPTDWS